MAESARFYTQNGERAPDVLNQSQTDKQGVDVFKAPDVSHARKFGYLPSVTTVLKMFDKPELSTYKLNQAIQAALDAPRIEDGQTKKEYFAMIRNASFAHAGEAADEGSAIHAAIYRFFEQGKIESKYAYIINSVNELCKSLVPENQMNDWVTEYEFACSAGYAGTVDLYHPKARIFIDWKTKADLSKPKPYEDTLYQLAAYSRGVNIDNGVASEQESAPTRCICGTISREVDEAGDYLGSMSTHEYLPDDIQNGYDSFMLMLQLWFRKNNHFPV